MKTQKDNSMEIFLVVAIFLAVGGLYYKRMYSAPKEDNVVEMPVQTKEMRDIAALKFQLEESDKIVKALHDEVSEQAKAIQELQNSSVKTSDDVTVLNSSVKSLTDVVKTKSEQLTRMIEKKNQTTTVKFDGPILFKMDKPPEVPKAAPKSPIKPLFNKAEMPNQSI